MARLCRHRSNLLKINHLIVPDDLQGGFGMQVAFVLSRPITDGSTGEIDTLARPVPPTGLGGYPRISGRVCLGGFPTSRPRLARNRQRGYEPMLLTPPSRPANPILPHSPKAARPPRAASLFSPEHAVRDVQGTSLGDTARHCGVRRAFTAGSTRAWQRGQYRRFPRADGPASPTLSDARTPPAVAPGRAG